MKSRSSFGIVAIFSLFLFLSGCQTASLTSRAAPAPEERVQIMQAQNSGVWKGKDIWVDYKYSREDRTLMLSGVVNFGNHLVRGFEIMSDFRMRVIFIDENGRILGTSGLLADRGDFSPISFKKKLAIPASTASFVFDYDGNALEIGPDGASMAFWQYAIY